MQIVSKICLGLAFVLFLTGAVCAQDEDATATATKELNRAKKKAMASMMRSMAAAELTEEQQTVVGQVVDKHIAALQAAKAAGYGMVGNTWIADVNAASLAQREKAGAQMQHRLHLFAKDL